MTALRHYWDQLQPRERRILAAGGAATVLLLLYAMVWEPFTGKLTQLEASVAAQRTTLAWMQQAATEARGARATPSTGTGGRSLLALSDETAKAHRLGEAVKRVQPDGQQTVRVWLEGAAFDDLLRWLDTLSTRHGIRIAALNVERIPATPGRVNARLSLEAPQ
jgi:general secretion pathway protein M